MAKLHLINGCAITRDHHLNMNATTDTNLVTCGLCRKRIKRLGLRPRREFPKIPTFQLQVDADGHTASFMCPVCGQRNHHGNHGKGYGGHRVEHCPCWENGYYVEI